MSAIETFVVDESGNIWVIPSGGGPLQLAGGVGAPVTGARSTGQLLTATSTGATWQAPTGGAPSGAAGGVLTGTYPNPGILTLNQSTTGNAATATTASTSSALTSATTTVNVSSATAPASGQVLTATGGSAATWQALPAVPEAWLPTDSGYQAWTFDPSLIASGSVAAAGTAYLIRVNVRAAVSITGVSLYVSLGGASLTLNECYAGLYNSSGQLVAVTGDQSPNWITAQDWNMALTVQASFTLTPLPAGAYWIALLANNTAGTQPTISHGTDAFTGAINLNLNSASTRAGTITGTGRTALPSSFTPSTGITQGSGLWWGALY